MEADSIFSGLFRALKRLIRRSAKTKNRRAFPEGNTRRLLYTCVQRKFLQLPLRPAVLLAGRSSTGEQVPLALVPPAGDGRESRGTSPSGAVCVRPPAAQADETLIFCIYESQHLPPAGDGRESKGTSPSGAVCVRPPAAQAERTTGFNTHECKAAD